MARMRRRLQDLATWAVVRAKDRRGGVAIMVAIMVVALIGMMALAVDVSAAVSAHTRLREAADVAALTAVRQAAVLTATSSTSDLTAAEAAGQQRFLAQASNNPQVTLDKNSVSVQVVRDGLKITSVVTFNATYKTQLAGMLNAISPSMTSFASLSLGGRVGAHQQIGAYIDVNVLMDTSNSMTITADKTNADLFTAIMQDFPLWHDLWCPWTPDQWYSTKAQQYPCTFACHATLDDTRVRIASVSDVNTRISGVTKADGTYMTVDPLPPNGPPIDPYAIAKDAGIQLRVDLLRNAVSLVASALASAQENAKFRFGFYTFDENTTQVYPDPATTPSASSGAPSGAQAKISSAQVTPYNYPPPDLRINPAQTNVGSSFDQFTSHILAAGDGASPDAPQQIVIILTDGVEDYNDSDGTRHTAVFDPSHCSTLKAPVSAGGKAAAVFVLHAASLDNFITMGQDPQQMFDDTVKAMQACASDSSHYFLASSPQEITNAIQTIIGLTLTHPTTITQGTLDSQTKTQ